MMFNPPSITIPLDDAPRPSWRLEPLFPIVSTPTRDQTEFERSFWAFVLWAWPIMRPQITAIEDPDYVEAICLHLQQITDPASLGITEGNRHLLMAIEPRSGKSDILALWAAWEWGPKRMPWLRHLVATHRTDALEENHEALIRLLLSSDYQDRWGDIVQKGRLFSWERINTAAGGGRQLVSKRMTIQGLPAHRLVCDDLIGDLEIDRPDARRKAMRFFNGSFRTRGIEKLATPTVVTHQRLQVDDPIGRLEVEEGLKSHQNERTGYPGTWDKLVFQTEYSGPVSDTTLTRAGKWTDKRTYGQVLRAAWTPDLLARIKARPDIWWPQHQQAPRSGQDAIWKRWWWRFWCYPDQPRHPVTVRLPDGTERDIPCVPLPVAMDRTIQSWDCAFKATATSSKVAGSVWAQHGSKFFWLHSRAGRVDILGTIQMMQEISKAFPQSTAKLIEDKANGPAVEQLMREKMPGIQMIQPKGSKPQRAGAAADFLQSGNCYLPHPSIAPWVGDFLDWADQWTGHSDEGTDLLDTASQAILWMAHHQNLTADSFEVTSISDWRRGPTSEKEDW